MLPFRPRALVAAGVVPVLVCALVLAALTGLRPGGGDASPTAVRPVADGDAGQQCADILLVGMDGSGEGPRGDDTFGRTLRVFHDAYAERVADSGRSLAAVRVPYDTRAPRFLLGEDRDLRAPAEEAVTPRKARGWRRGAAAALDRTMTVLDERAARCPEQQWVLAGYAQGAFVQRVAARRLKAQGEWGRVAGVALVADGARRADTRGRGPVGDPGAPRSSAGVVTELFRAYPDAPGPGGIGQVWNVCTAGDAICDLRRHPVGPALRRHRSYRDGAGAEQVERVAAITWHRTRLAPVPAPREQTVGTTPGASVQHRLSVDVNESQRPVVHYRTDEDLPGDLTLGEDGVLSGTAPAEPGTYSFTYQVRNARHDSPPVTGEATLRVVPGDDEVTAGGLSACQLRQGVVECWGKNDFGQLGDGTRTTRVNPQQVGSAQDWQDVSTGGAATCGIRGRGTLWCWGLNNRGQLGNGTHGDQQRPTRVGDDADWRSVSAGWWHSCGIRADGSAWCWGNNDYGQLGVGSHRDRARPVQVAGGHTWSSLTVGKWHTCGVRTDGTAWCWGANDMGQIGTSGGQRLRPHQVGTDDGWTRLSAGTRHTCGLTAGGGIRCWGLGYTGQLGRGSTASGHQPRLVDATARFVDVSAGDGHTCALDADGAAWCWGDNRHGELGITEPDVHPRPVRVPGTRGASLATGWMHSCVRRLGATRASCVGNNEDGQLGNGSLRPEPGVPPEQQPALSPDRFRVATYNVLGSQHTAPRGGRSRFAPWRLRMEWAMDSLDRLRASIVGFQELQPAQYGTLAEEYDAEWNFHPRTWLGRDAVLTNMMWRRDVWQVTERDYIETVFWGSKRERPIVRLRHRATGQQVWVMNVHNSPSTRSKSRQDQRDAAVRDQVRKILEMRGSGYPVLFIGDMNERRPVFCKVEGNTDLEASNGGSHVNGTCDPPDPMRVDWIFGSPVSGNGQYAEFVNHTHRRYPLVRRLTDHPIITAVMRLRR